MGDSSLMAAAPFVFCCHRAKTANCFFFGAVRVYYIRCVPLTLFAEYGLSRGSALCRNHWGAAGKGR